VDNKVSVIQQDDFVRLERAREEIVQRVLDRAGVPPAMAA